MLDKLLGAITHKLTTHKAAVLAQRAAIELERAGDDARQHAGREFENSEGFTTPLPKAAENAQNEYARLRREFFSGGGADVLATIIALVVARERRDETAAALKRHEESEALRQDTGVHKEVKAAFGLLFKHGLEPRHLANVRPHTAAVVADLLRWDGHDPEGLDPDSPVRAVFALYASRLVVIPKQLGDKGRSSTDTRPIEERIYFPRYYPFGDAAYLPLLRPGRPPVLVAQEPSPTAEAGSAAMIDCSIYPDEVEPVEPVEIEAEVDDAPMSPDRARAIAEIITDRNEYRMAYYWPKEGVDRDDYTPERLIPALQRWVESGEAWSGASSFLEAAIKGEAREFIAIRRKSYVETLTSLLLEGDGRTIADAKRLGVDV